MTASIQTQFADAIRAAGIEPPNDITADGKLHRFPTNGKRSDAAGYYILHGDGIPAGAFGCWRAGINETWRAELDRPLSETEQRVQWECIEAIRRARDAEQIQRQQEAAEQAAQLWDAASPANPGHEYLERKGIAPCGVRVDKGRLLVPARDIDGNLQSLQTIAPDGSKLFAKGGRIKGGFFAIGEPGGSDALIIAEGFATAASIHTATGLPSIATFSANNLEPVARAIRESHPAVRLVIVADNDIQTAGNPGVTAARKAAMAVRGLLAIPDAIDGKPTDANNLMLAQGTEAVQRLIDSAAPPAGDDGWTPPAPITPQEWQTARLAPDCIVQDYLFADAAVQVAPGGTGKTTLNLFEAVHIALGLPLYGLEIHRPGPVVILTGEDSREMLTARLRRIAEAMQLTPAQVQRLQQLARISDVCGAGLRLTEVLLDTVRPAAFVDDLAEGLQALAPSLLVIDPAVSFGVGESRVNDAEQGLIEAARRLRRELNCCVRYIHHTGQHVAREKIRDQYAGRGGTAFADGARMVHVLQPLDPASWRKATGTDLAPGETGLILARPKMSYCPPQGDILLRRDGYLFEHVEAAESSPVADLERDAETILAAVRGLERPTQNTLAVMDTGLSRDRTRAVVRFLLDDGRLVYKENTRKGGAQKYLAVIDSRTPSARLDETTGSCADEKSAKVGARPYREKETRAPSRGLSPSAPKVSGEPSRTPSAHLAQLDPETWDSEI